MKSIILPILIVLPLLVNAQEDKSADLSYSEKMRKFREGTLVDQGQILKLAYQAKAQKDTAALTVARQYKQRFLDESPVESLLTPNNGKFIEQFYPLFSPKDPIVKYMSRYPKRVDSILKWENYARQLSDYLISKQYIDRSILPSGVPIKTVPGWSKMQKQIVKDFDKKTAERVILSSKISWAHRHKRTEEAVKYEFERIDKYGMDTTVAGRVFFNNMVYSVVFTKISDTALLKKAATLMRYINELEKHQNSTYIDTYAGLLYKAGNKSEALIAENAALELAKKQNKQEDVQFYATMIQRMKNGEEIWKEDK